MAIIRDRELIEKDIPVELIASCIMEHQEGIERLNLLDNYYLGKHAILERPSDEDKGLPNNRLVANHAKYITDISSGFVFGNPVKYEGAQIEAIMEAYKAIDIVSHDSELSKDLSVFGRGLELYFMSSDEVPIPKVAVIDPRQIFLVVDDTVEYKTMFGVHYYEKRDIDNEVNGFNVNVYSETEVIKYFVKEVDGKDYESIGQEPHYYGAVPITEFSNNEEQQGDYEQQISMIDAYNVLQSDRVNDKEQLVTMTIHTGGTKEEHIFYNAENSEGVNFKCDNPLINTIERAQEVAQWVIDESNLRALYQVNWRQNPALECGDIVLIEDSFGAEKQSRITKQEYNFSGYLSGRTDTKGGV